jgi:hypothetical protein
VLIVDAVFEAAQRDNSPPERVVGEVVAVFER